MAESKIIKVGLDIGTNSVKILQIGGEPDKPVLEALGVKKIRGIAKSELAQAIKELAAQSKVSAKEANISVSGQSVIVRFISMPKMDNKALKGAVRFEAEKFVPFDINDCIVDFKTIKSQTADNRISIVLVAAKKGAVEERVKMAEEAGFSVRVVDVDCFALANSFSRNFPAIGADKTCALIDIGGTFTNLCILRGDAVFFARDIAIGTGDISSVISKRMGLDSKAAEELMFVPKEKSQEVAEHMKTVFNNLLGEVKLSLSYYENQGGRSIDEIYISGGGMGLFGLNEVFQETLGSKPILWKPLGFLDKEKAMIDKAFIDSQEPSLAIAAGLALR
ncbi:MAG: type IV pilus assembly protein PilM [Candidatus Omnitrophota bacterium]